MSKSLSEKAKTIEVDLKEIRTCYSDFKQKTRHAAQETERKIDMNQPQVDEVEAIKEHETAKKTGISCL